MKTLSPISLLALGVLAASVGATAAPARHDHHHAALASATLRAADGSAKGTARIVGKAGRWELKVAVEGLPAGLHGAHLHTVGKCDAADFASAGGHLNPHGKMHGSENPQGMHLGDLPNLTVGADGKGSLTTMLADSAAELERALFDADGTAVVVHAGPDDNKTDPSGNSGGRIACGVLTRS